MSASTTSKRLVVHCQSRRSKFLQGLQYAADDPSFMAVREVEGNKILTSENCEQFGECRELVLGSMRSILADMKGQQGKDFNGFEKLRYLMGYSAARASRMKGCCTIGLRIVHAYDSLLHCRPTHVMPVRKCVSWIDGKFDFGEKSVILVEADRKWSKAPELVSLHMLLLRLGRHTFLEPLLRVPLKDIPTKIVELAEEQPPENDDVGRIQIYGSTWPKILKEFEKRFAKKKFSTTFYLGKPDANDGGLMEDGIDTLCEQITGKDLYDEMDQRSYNYDDREDDY